MSLRIWLKEREIKGLENELDEITQFNALRRIEKELKEGIKEHMKEAREGLK